MPTFKSGDFANIRLPNGEEITVKIMGEVTNGLIPVGRYDDGSFSGRTENVSTDRLLPLRGPYFAVRGQVLTTSTAHPSEVGEIVGTGGSKSGKAFYRVQFSDGLSEWFNEDQVFIDDETKRAHEKAKRNDGFFT